MKEKSLISEAIHLASTEPDVSKKLEMVRAAVVLESRKNRFLVTWCLKYTKFDYTFLGYPEKGGPAKFRDDTLGFVTTDPGAGVLSAFRTISGLLRGLNAGLLSIEHPEDGLEERHLAPLTDLLVLSFSDGPLPWFKDFTKWVKAGCPAEFKGFVPRVDP